MGGLVMKRMGLLMCAVAILGAGCDDDSPTTPSNANQAVFTAALSAANEVPPIANAEANARGNAQITFDLTRDGSGALTAATVTWAFNLSDFPPGSSAVAAHIHLGGAGVAGGVHINTGLSAANALALPDGRLGTHIVTTTATATELGRIQAILDNPAGYYFNVHSPINPGGVVRGQLTRIQ
jgi:CHRD domain